MKLRYLALASTALLAGVAAYKIIAPKRADKDNKEPGGSKSGERHGPIAQGRQAEVKNEAADALNEFKEAAGVQLSTAEHVLTDFKSKLNSANKDVKDRYQKVVDKLEKRGQKMKDSLADMKEDGKEKWEDMKRAFNEEFSMYNEELRGLSLEEHEA